MPKYLKPPLTCKGCGREIVFLPTKNGKSIPVDYASYDNDAVFDPRFHTSHFATCPKAKEFRKSTNNRKEVK